MSVAPAPCQPVAPAAVAHRGWRRPLGLAGVAIAFSAAMLVIVWVSIALVLRWQWQDTLGAQERQNSNTALALKEHTLRVLEVTDQALLRLQADVQASGYNSQAIARYANETGMVPEILTQLSFVGPDGRFVGSNLDPDGSRSQNVSLMERDHVRVHLLPAVQAGVRSGVLHDGLFISQALQGKVSGRWTIQLSRKVVAPDGQVLGVVVASLNQNHFVRVYEAVRLGQEGGVALAGFDSFMRVRVVGGEQQLLEQATMAREIQLATRAERHGVLRATSTDGVARIHGFSRVGDYPLVVLAGTSENEAFAAWRANRNTIVLLAGLLSALVVVFVGMFVASVRRLARSYEALAVSEAHAKQANQAKTEFLAAMSHELRTPLTSIRGFAELMELRSSEPRVREQAGHIRQGAEHLNALLTEILDLAKIEAGAMPTHPEPVALQPLLQEVTDFFRISALAKGLALHLEVAQGTPNTLVTDRLKLKQMLNNLLSNAIKFTDHGQVVLRAHRSVDGQQLLLQVIDTGCGIALDQQARIFEKFSQGNARVSYQHGGTGLGLSLSRALAELLGGSLNLHSREGEGATFTIALPLAVRGA